MRLLGLGLVRRFAHEAMGTIFEVAIAGQEGEYARQASQAVFREVDRLERLLSRFNPCSEIGQINALPPGGSLRIGLEVYECLATAEQVRLDTAGAFDINFRALLRTWDTEGQNRGQRDRRKIAALPSVARNDHRQLLRSISKEKGNIPSPFVNHLNYQLSSTPDGFSIRVPETGAKQGAAPLDLDLGGIGKGYALDRALSILSDWSEENALVHSGTSTALAAGSAPELNKGEQGWPLGVGGKWTAGGALRRVLLRNRALSGSGIEVKGQHILDPRTGREAQSHLAAWASHPSAAVADALSTAFMAMTLKEVRAYCRRHPEVWALVITRTGKPVTFNPGILAPPAPLPPR